MDGVEPIWTFRTHLDTNSAREAVTKLCTLPLLAGPNIDAGFVVPTVAGCVDVVVHLASEPEGRRVREICALPGRTESGVVEMADLFAHDGSALVRRNGFPPHEHRFERLGYRLAELLHAPRASSGVR